MRPSRCTTRQRSWRPTTVAVEDMAVQLLVSAGFDQAAALASLQPLVAGTASNINALGTTNALTGPIARGDVDTVRGHVEALRRLPGTELSLYRALGRHTLEIAIRRGTLSAERVEALHDVLADDNTNGCARNPADE